jgi:hypothetical protein
MLEDKIFHFKIVDGLKLWGVFPTKIIEWLSRSHSL